MARFRTATLSELALRPKVFAGFCGAGLSERIAFTMNAAVHSFYLAHERYLELDQLRTQCTSANEREFMHLQIMTAYLEVQYRARMIAGLQFADGNDYAEEN